MKNEISVPTSPSPIGKRLCSSQFTSRSLPRMESVTAILAAKMSLSPKIIQKPQPRKGKEKVVKSRDEEQGWHDICNGEDKKDEDNMGSEEGSTEDESSNWRYKLAHMLQWIAEMGVRIGLQHGQW